MKKIAKISETLAKEIAKQDAPVYTNEIGDYAVLPEYAEQKFDSDEYLNKDIDDNAASLFVQLTYSAAGGGTWPVRKDKKMFPF